MRTVMHGLLLSSHASVVYLIFFLFFFFLMIRRPPRSTLFPTRRSSDLGFVVPAGDASPGFHLSGKPPELFRSEEHTSELQSHSDLVCRLLLEKKKKEGNSTHGVGNVTAPCIRA